MSFQPRHVEPMEVLQHLRPQRDRSAARPGDDPRLDAAFASVRAAAAKTSPTWRRRRSWRRWFGIGAVGAITVGGASIATARWLADDQPDDPMTVACWSAADPAADQAGLVTFGDPVDACRMAWSRGELGDVDVPTLTACVTPYGTVAVIPDEAERCEELGFAVLDDSTPHPSQQEVELLTERLIVPLGERCMNRDDTVELVEAVLGDAMLVSWSARTAWELDGLDRACGAVTLDVPNRTVLVVARSRPPGG